MDQYLPESFPSSKSMNIPVRKMSITKMTVLVIFFCVTSFSVAAQYKVSGQIISDSFPDNVPATIRLLQEKDSMLLKTVIGELKGKFVINDVSPGSYILSVSMLGHKFYFKNISIKDADIDLGSLMAEKEFKQLDVVTVNAKVKLFEMKGDKMIVNIAANPIISGLNGLELIEKMPGISVNRQTETINMVGKAGVLVMIDDRPSYLSGKELVLFLQTLKSDEFDKVEIITNPSARYDAAGTNGIINLKTKAGKRFGTNYTIDLMGDYSSYAKFGNYFKHNQAFTLNSKKKDYVLYANINHNKIQDFNAADESLKLFDNGLNLTENRTNYDLDKGQNDHWTLNTSIDFNLPRRTVFGLSFYSTFFDGKKDRKLQQRSNQTSAKTDDLRQETMDKFRYYLFTAHYGHTFDSLGTALTADIDVVFNKWGSDSYFKTVTTTNGSSASIDNQLFNDKKRVSYIFKAHFEKLVSPRRGIEIGLKSRISNIDNEFSDNFQNTILTNNQAFLFFENINALYGLYGGEWNSRTRFEMGIRAEYTHTKGKSRIGAVLSEQDYINLFPSFSVNYRVSEKYGVSVAYSRRIGRPDGDVFNVFRRFTSLQSYTEGNPLIEASINNSFALSATVNDKYFYEVSYVKVKNFATQVFDIDPFLSPGKNLVRTSQENVGGKVGWINLKGFIPHDLTDRWHFDFQFWTGVNLYNYKRKDANVDLKQFYWGGSLDQNFTINKLTSASVSGTIISGETAGFQTSKPMGSIDFGLRRQILNKKGSIKVSLQDPFNFNQNRSTFNTGNLTGGGVYNWNNRRFVMNFSYNFGNRNVQTERWQSKFQEAAVQGNGKN